MTQNVYDSIRNVTQSLTRKLNREASAPQKVHWNVAGAFNHVNTIQELWNVLHDFGVTEHALYQSHDCLPGMIWNGGRVVRGVQTTQVGFYSKEDALEIVARLNELGVGVYLTFSNHLIEEPHLDDERCNFMLEGISHCPLNGVVCSSDLLLSYIRRTYPDMKVKLSVIRSYVDRIWAEPRRAIQDWHARMFDLYDSVGLNPNLNKSFGIIEKLPLDRLEAMVSLCCEFKCPIAHLHYESSARANLYGSQNWDVVEGDLGYCQKKKHGTSGYTPETVQLCNETVNRLRAIGVSYFKIHGKSDNYWDLGRNINYYILNPLGLYVDWHMNNGTLTITRAEVGRREFREGI